MSLAVSSKGLSVGLAVIFAGWAIKLMDDYVDCELDQVLSRANLTRVLGDGVPIYMAFALAMAIYLAPETGMTLFLAAYLVGMGQELGARYRGGWWAWVEAAVSAVLGMTIELRQFALNLALISLIQLCDDLVDYRQDLAGGRSTLPTRCGPVVSALIAISLAAWAWVRSPVYSAWVMAIACLIAAAAERIGAL